MSGWSTCRDCRISYDCDCYDECPLCGSVEDVERHDSMGRAWHDLLDAFNVPALTVTDRRHYTALAASLLGRAVPRTPEGARARLETLEAVVLAYGDPIGNAWCDLLAQIHNGLPEVSRLGRIEELLHENLPKSPEGQKARYEILNGAVLLAPGCEPKPACTKLDRAREAIDRAREAIDRTQEDLVLSTLRAAAKERRDVQLTLKGSGFLVTGHVHALTSLSVTLADTTGVTDATRLDEIASVWLTPKKESQSG